MDTICCDNGGEGKEVLESGQDRVEFGTKLLDWMAKAWKGTKEALSGKEVYSGRWGRWLEPSITSATVENVTVALLWVRLILVLRLRGRQRRLAGGV